MQDLAADEDIEARLRAAAAAGDESLRETALALAAELCERGDATGEQAAALAMYKSAERAALTALEHLPNCPTLLAMVGRARVRCADRSSDKKDKLATLAAAVEILDRALRLDPDDPAALIYRGVTFKIGGDLEASSAAKCEAYGRSESFFRRVLEKWPERWEALQSLGSVTIALGNLRSTLDAKLETYAQADAYYHRVLDLQPDRVITLHSLGLLLKARGDLEPSRAAKLEAYAQAETYYRRVLDLQPDYIWALNSLGALLKARGDLEPSRAAKLEAYAQAETYYRRVLDLQPDPINTLGSLGLLLRDRGNLEPSRAARLEAYAQAEVYYRRVLDLQPDRIATLHNLGILYYDRGDLEPSRAAKLEAYAQAEVYYRRVLDLQPDYIWALSNLGTLLKDRGALQPSWAAKLEAYAQAETYYRRVLALQPERIATLHSLGLLLKARGDLEPSRAAKLEAYAKAETYYRRVLDFQPDYIWALSNLGVLLKNRADLEPSRAARLEAYSQAETYYRRVLDLRPDWHSSSINLGWLLVCRGEHETSAAARAHARNAAEALFQRVIEVHPDRRTPLNNLGLLWKLRGDEEPARAARLLAYEKAEAYFTRVLELQPDWPLTLTRLGDLFRARGDHALAAGERQEVYGTAETKFRRVIELQPDDGDALRGLASLLQTQGDQEPSQSRRLELYGTAERYWQRLLELHPEDVETLVRLGMLFRARGDMATDQASTLDAYKAAEGSLRRALELQPQKLTALIELARLHLALADHASGLDRRFRFEAAARVAEEALALEAAPAGAVRVLFAAELGLIELEGGEGKWQYAADRARRLLERRRSFDALTTDRHFRTTLSAAAWPLGPIGGVCQLRAGDPEAAVAHVDANLASSLAEALAAAERALATVGDGTVGSTLAERQAALGAARRQLARLDEQAPAADAALEATRRGALAETREQVASLQAAVRAEAATIPALERALRPGSDIELIREAARQRPLVYLAASPWGGHALMVHAAGVTDVPLPDLADTSVADRLQAWNATYAAVAQAAEQGAELRRDSRFPLGQSNRPPPFGRPPPGALDRAWAAFDRQTRDLCRWLGEAVMQPVLAVLAELGADRAVLLPSGRLTYLPLHAAITGGSDERPTLALEQLGLSYAANARLARDSAARLAAGSPSPPAVTAILDPAYGQGGPARLGGCTAERKLLEAQAAAGRIRLRCHAGAAAQVTPPGTDASAFPIAALAAQTILHLGCHGRTDHEDVFASSLLLAPASDHETEQRIPVSTILDTWPVDKLRLVVLSCCEGAMSGRQSFDELISLQTAFAQGGAAAVVGAMWAVRDDHTAALMQHFYDALLVDPTLDPAKALAKAQVRLLDTTPEAFPTIAAFQVLQG